MLLLSMHMYTGFHNEENTGKGAILKAVLLLVGELDKEELTKVQEKVNNLLQ